MNDSWRAICLRDVLERSDDWINIETDKTYKQVTVQLWGKGVNLRNEIIGAEIVARRRLVVRSQQFILSRIDARNGAFGIVPEFLDGAVVSNDFPVFKMNSSLIVPSFLSWMSKTRSFVNICKASSEGTTNRVRLNIESFLDAEILLPSTEEQCRIVARIEELAARIEEARELRSRAAEDYQSLWNNSFEGVFGEDNLVKLGDISEFVTKGATPTTYGHDWENEGILFLRSQCIRGGYISKEGSLRISQAADEMLARSRVKPYDILYNITGASIGRCAMFPPELHKANINQHIALIRLKNIADPRYITYCLNNPALLRHSISIQAGGAQPLLSLKQIKNFDINLPHIYKQRSIVAYLESLQSKLSVLKRHQAETAAQLDALMPAILDRAFRGDL